MNRPNFKVYEESYLLNEPLSPHAAAKVLENENIFIEKVNLPTKTSKLIIEGAGGLLVPINYKNETICDLIIKFKRSVILVVKEYLGNIKHTLLTISHLKQKTLMYLELSM